MSTYDPRLSHLIKTNAPRIAGPRSPTAPKTVSNGRAPGILANLPLIKEDGTRKIVPKMQSAGGSKSKKTRTSEKIIINGKKLTVYKGPKGGKYIRTKTGFASIK